jgi:quercetin dioxygenase-like cupin family protein
MADQRQARPDRPAAGPLVHVRLQEGIERLKHEPAWRSGDRNAITLTKEPALRVVLMALHKGARVHEHRAGGSLTFQLITGAVRFRAAGRDVELGPGEVVVLEPAVAHELEALAESACLLTLTA